MVAQRFDCLVYSARTIRQAMNSIAKAAIPMIMVFVLFAFADRATLQPENIVLRPMR